MYRNYMKTSIFIILFLFSIISVSAQSSEFNLRVSIGIEDDVVDVVETADGSYVAVANSLASVPGKNDIVIIKISSTGTVLRSKLISTNTEKIASSICTLSDGGFLITGQYSYFNTIDAMVIKLDSIFNIQFFKTYGLTTRNEFANSCFEMNPGNYYVIGSPDIWVLNDSGNVSREFAMDSCYCSGSGMGNLKGSYIGNGVISLYGTRDFVHLIDTNGTTLKKVSQFIPNGYENVILKDNGGNFLVSTGVFNSTFNSDGLGLILFDSITDTIVWQKLHQKYLFDSFPVGMSQDSAGNYYIGVNMGPWSNGNTVPGIVKTDSAGNFLWARSFVDSSIVCSYLNKIIPTSDNGFLMVGKVCLPTGRAMQFIKCDSAANTVCNTTSWIMSTFGINFSGASYQAYGSGSSIAKTVTPGTTIPNPTSTMPCSTTGVNVLDIKVNNAVVIYPTLFQNEINLEVNSPASCHVAIYNVNGQLSATFIITGNESINLEKLPSGPYVVRVTSTDETYYSVQRIVKL